MFEVRRYMTPNGVDVFGTWLLSLRDEKAKARIRARITRLSLGNFGDCKALREGVSELRIDHGPGYRVYFARVGEMIVLLLAGGDKATQRADIAHAVQNLHDFKRRQP